MLGRLIPPSLFGRRFSKRAREPGPEISLYDHGLAIVLPPGLEAADLGIVLTDATGRSLLEPTQTHKVVEGGGRRVLAVPLDPALFERALSCRLTIEVGGAVTRRRFRLGPGLFSGRIEGVADYGLVGWISPLFASPSFALSLLVDGEAEAATTPNRFRPDLMGANRHGGWNGFALPLPARALDGKPHRLAVRAGQTLLEFGGWSAKPRFNIDHASARRFTGWFFETHALPGGATLRLAKDGHTVRTVSTHFRPDLAEAFGRDSAAFAFTKLDLEAGQELVAGPEDAGLVVGQVVPDRLAERVNARRAEARAQLLGSERASDSLPARRASRASIVGEVRTDEGSRFGFRPAVSGQGLGREPAAIRAAAVRGGARIRAVCAIVPVYKGLADLRLCLESLLPQLDPRHARALVIDDASPEPGVAAYLAALAAEDRPGLTVLTNPANLGFIGTVNRGFALLASGEDALLVNADTILPPGAVARLARHCHARPGVASVTPMSNNATILSFPGASEPNPPALGLDVETIDRAFQAVAGETGADAPIEIPTGIGFCLYLHAEALAEVGVFSPEWGRGYCEEVEWSLVARDLGWIHLAAPDVFVMHEGSVSFGIAERAAILLANHARLEALYPEYMDEVRDIIAADPFETVRARALARLMAGRVRRLTVHLTHALGGGTRRYIDDLCALPRAADHEVAVLSPVVVGEHATGRLRLAFQGAATAIELSSRRLEAVLGAFEAAGMSVGLHVNARLGFFSEVLAGIAAGRRPYVVTLHDFQWYCPKVQLTDEREFYCGEPPPAVCQICVRHRPKRPRHDFADQNGLVEQDLETWLAFNERFLRGAERLLAPSRDTAERYARRLGLPDIAVVPHLEPAAARAGPTPFKRGPGSGLLKVAVVGAIGPHKGLEVLRRLAEHAAARRLPFYLRIVGYTSDDETMARLSNVSVSGRYGPGELGGLLDAFAPDLVFLSSVWPETYSYVLSEVWDAGYPVVAFDLGAPADRIREAGGGALIPPTRDAGELYAALLAARERLADVAAPPRGGSPPRGASPSTDAEPSAGPATLEAYYRAAGADGAERSFRTGAGTAP